MKKSYSIAGVLIIFILIVAYFSLERSPISDTLLVTSFDDDTAGAILVQIPFIRSLKTDAVISVAIDTNSDGAFSEDELLLAPMPAKTRADWHQGFYASTTVAIESGQRAVVTLNGREYPVVVEKQQFAMAPLFGLATVTDPENATKGWGAATAHAEEAVSITQDGVPDLAQRPAECGPTAAANSLISLVAKHGGEDLIPGDPQDFIENLKRHMNWTPENGTPPDDFVAGKNRWAAAAGVPIRTTKVGDAQGLSTIDDIREALKRGDAVEMRIRFTNPEGSAIIGGHMVTVVGIHQANGQTYLDINDPATPNSGTETVEVRTNRITNYAYDSGYTLLSWGFVQTWEGHPMGELFDTMTDEEIQGIRQAVGETPMLTVIEHRGDYIQTSQLRVGDAHPPHENGEGCPERHWHAAGPVTTVSGRTVADPNPGGCGFGMLSKTPSQQIPAPDLSGADRN